jgi:hypothetical protein
VEERVFTLGLATSTDGVTYSKHPASPVYSYGNDRESILTPSLLRRGDGSLLREDGRLRMWFSAADLTSGSGRHVLRETTSIDGLSWSPPSERQLEGAYAPTVFRVDDIYRMWYTDVTADPWCIRHAQSVDGRSWRASPDPALRVDQAWEVGRLFYPTVLAIDGLYLMWYGSYWGPSMEKTALGLAISQDGLKWRKNPCNPVFRPEERREWESHYTTSQSVLRLADGSWRLWYASRTRPPFAHKYYAIGTASWVGPVSSVACQGGCGG